MTLLNDIQVWTTACAYDRLIPGRGVGVLLDDGTQAALFRLDDGSVCAVGNVDPFSGAPVLSRGIVGDRRRFLPGRPERLGAGVPGAHHARRLRPGRASLVNTAHQVALHRRAYGVDEGVHRHRVQGFRAHAVAHDAQTDELRSA